MSRSAVYIRTLLYRAPGATHATLGHTHTVDGNRQAPRPHDSRHTHRRRGVWRRPCAQATSAAARGARAAAFVDPPITRMLCAPIVPLRSQLNVRIRLYDDSTRSYLSPLLFDHYAHISPMTLTSAFGRAFVRMDSHRSVHAAHRPLRTQIGSTFGIHIGWVGLSRSEGVGL